MPRINVDADGLTIACPACDEAGQIYAREGPNTHAGDPEAPLVCGACSTTLESAVVRPTKARPYHHAGGAPTYDLEDRDPEAVGLSPIGDRGRS